ncbi:GntR family transcriptional regulator [Azospirillum agricola]|uniref:GntR family transcriptional regulator n=1 Tax=Azospirillum agricola TaxID=1720247 RepID=UPI000A0EF6C4|nr:GntR family transcriptional regulator [Azospirillum agricola]SMH46033.1 transcriptional regulator, GntR family [Azospirillum lipoferum]
MKTNTLYKRSYNQCLDLVAARTLGGDLGSENELAAALDVSRTTVRAVLDGLTAAGLIGIDKRAKRILRHPAPADYYPDTETESVATTVEKKFMAWIQQGDCKPGQHISGLDLARQFGTSNSAIREHLNQFSYFGLLERRPNSRWVFRGFTEEFAEELTEVREMFELRSARRFIELDAKSPLWQELDRIEEQHVALLKDIDQRFMEFSELDQRFHSLINEAAPNRFMEMFFDVISMVFHYHYPWNKRDEKERNAVAIQEHLAYIRGLKSRDPERMMTACRAHLDTARASLLRSMEVRR